MVTQSGHRAFNVRGPVFTPIACHVDHGSRSVIRSEAFSAGRRKKRF